MTQDEFGQNYESGFRSTVRLLQSRGASPNQAEDLAQAAWLQGWRQLDQLRDKALILRWINSIALNYQRRGGRIEARYRALAELEIVGRLGIESAPLDIEMILRTCRPRERAILEKHLEGRTAKEIARQEGISAAAVRLRLFRARRAVRSRLEGAAAIRLAA